MICAYSAYSPSFMVVFEDFLPTRSLLSLLTSELVLIGHAHIFLLKTILLFLLTCSINVFYQQLKINIFLISKCARAGWVLAYYLVEEELAGGETTERRLQFES